MQTPQEKAFEILKEKIVFFDIETIRQYDPTQQEKRNDETTDIRAKKYWENNEPWRMALYPEFGKVVAIVFGYEQTEPNWIEVELKSWIIKWDDEKKILEDAAIIFDKCPILWGFNILSFDIPFLCRRYMVHGMQIPKAINTYGMKPRDVPHIDVMNMWKMWGIAAGLETICNTLGIATPKWWEVEWSTLNEKYRASKESQWLMDLFMQQTGDYCKKDVIATIAVFNKIKNSFIL